MVIFPLLRPLVTLRHIRLYVKGPWDGQFPSCQQGDCIQSQRGFFVFSGIIEEVGQIMEITQTTDGCRLTIGAKKVVNPVNLGDSISVDGICLTVVSFDSGSFSVEAVLETMRRTKLGEKKVGDAVNLERAVTLNDRLGGHLVTGHIDAVAAVSKVEEDGFSKLITFELPGELAPYFVPKGSVAVDGVSLTVVDCPIPKEGENLHFSVALIPHTLDATTFKSLKPGSKVNIETDVVARYVARWLEPHLDEKLKKVAAKISSGASNG
jgi:riboflavin synthase